MNIIAVLQWEQPHKRAVTANHVFFITQEPDLLLIRRFLQGSLMLLPIKSEMFSHAAFKRCSAKRFFTDAFFHESFLSQSMVIGIN
jgi:hypothetical protein